MRGRHARGAFGHGFFECPESVCVPNPNDLTRANTSAARSPGVGDEVTAWDLSVSDHRPTFDTEPTSEGWMPIVGISFHGADSALVESAVEQVECLEGRVNTGVVMKGFVQDIEGLATQNGEFRRVLYTATSCQLVLMALKPQEEIGLEVHKLDQFFRVEAGSGDAILDGVRTPIRAGFAVLVPAGAKHNIINTGAEPMKLYTLYAPPNHRDGVVHHTRTDAEADSEHFDGKTSE
jgi:mannose-6-phosphate isomerase-like protein (cupin superfamily)